MKGVSITLLSSNQCNAIVVYHWRFPGVLERSSGSSAGHPAKLGGSVHCATANAQEAWALSQTLLTGRLQLTLFLVNPELHRIEYMNVYVPWHSR